jgi:hypothetical protein
VERHDNVGLLVELLTPIHHILQVRLQRPVHHTQMGSPWERVRTLDVAKSNGALELGQGSIRERCSETELTLGPWQRPPAWAFSRAPSCPASAAQPAPGSGYIQRQFRVSLASLVLKNKKNTAFPTILEPTHYVS